LVIWIIYLFVVIAFIAAIHFTRKVYSVRIEDGKGDLHKLRQIAQAIQEGAMAFLSKEYQYVGGFVLVFSLVIILSLNSFSQGEPSAGFYTAIAFFTGAFVSSLSAFLGMKIATNGNFRTTIQAQKSLGEGFLTAFQSGAVMGFSLIGFAVFGLMTSILFFSYLIPDNPILVMEIVSGFGLGGSTVALFGRVGGGIYTKAADIGADLVGKVEAGIPEDDPRNPAVIADNVGDNVGDIAGMGADLFGSCAEATCAALVIGATAMEVRESAALYYPLLISAVGIPVCLLTAYFVKTSKKTKVVEPILKKQLLISTIIMTFALYFTTHWGMVEHFELGSRTIYRSDVLFSVLAGLWSGLLIGYVTEYYTSHAYRPVREIANASKTGAATNIIYGLSLGYQSAVIPVISIALTVYLSWFLAGMYGIALSAIGMISTIATGLTIDAYGPVADNAGGIAEMCKFGDNVRRRTDLLDAAGNTTAAIGKGFAIGSALLTALALFGAYLTVANIHVLDLLSPSVMASLLVGAVLPFMFTAQTLKAVGNAAYVMIKEVRRQFKEIPGILEGTAPPDYKKCVAISTTSAIQHMMAPGLLVILTPLVFGILFGENALAGLLVGSLLSGLVLALSSANSGGAWDNAKKYIETGVHGGKGSEAHKAAVVGDTVGDPFKDTSGPSLNILMKLMAILSLVFAPFIIGAHQFLQTLF